MVFWDRKWHLTASWDARLAFHCQLGQGLRLSLPVGTAWNHKIEAQANFHACRGFPGETGGHPGNAQGRTTGGVEETTTIPHAWRPLKGSADIYIYIWREGKRDLNLMCKNVFGSASP